MLLPRKMKFRKYQRGTIRRVAKGATTLAFGELGLKALEGGWVTAREIEAARRAITRFFKREGQIWIRVFPDKPVTKKPTEARMGKGKGDVDHFVAVVEPGRILFEVAGIDKKSALEGLRLAQGKLSVKTKIVEKHEA
ncbi:50S ribosomal protein L16 [bacterium]|nr:50S ribosomal protein L16 [bacterium]